MRASVPVTVLAMMIAADTTAVTGEAGPPPAPVIQKAGQWETRNSFSAFVGDAHLLEQVSALARQHLPLLARAVDQEETAETVHQACWSEATARRNDVPDPGFVLAALHREFADLPCTEPEHAANEAILQCDFGNGMTATRSLTVASNTSTGFEIADDMMLERSDAPDRRVVVMHWRIATKLTWLGPHCATAK